MSQEIAVARAAERDALLQRLTTALQRDSRIGAAWLWGSLGRGEGDAFSDIDLWSAVDDHDMPNLLAHLPAFVGRIESPLLIMESLHNGPPGGICLHVIFDGDNTGPHNVDWYFVPQSVARILPNTKVLFDKVGTPATEDAPTFGNPEPARSRTAASIQSVRFFWMMLLVCAKYVYRSPDEERMRLLVYVVDALNDIRKFCGEMPGPAADDLPIHPSSQQKLGLLRVLASNMATRMPKVETQAHKEHLTWSISSQIERSTYRFLNTISTAIAERG